MWRFAFIVAHTTVGPLGSAVPTPLPYATPMGTPFNTAPNTPMFIPPGQAPVQQRFVTFKYSNDLYFQHADDVWTANVWAATEYSATVWHTYATVYISTVSTANATRQR